MSNPNASSNKSKLSSALSSATAPGTNTPGTNTPGSNTPGTNTPGTNGASGNGPDVKALGTVPSHSKSGVLDRRLGVDRRDLKAAKAHAASEANSDHQPVAGGAVAGKDADTFVDAATGLERRRGPGRRLSDFTRRAEEGELTKEQFLFLMAIESFKKANDRPYPTWTDVLEVVRLLGYRKTMPMEMTLRNAEDWRETADAPANVRPDKWHLRAA